MQTGDVSCHHGWTLHTAPKHPSATPPRLALAVSYFADGARVHDWAGDKSLRAELQNAEDLESYESWLPAVKSGALARHADIPLVFRRDKASD